MKGQDEEGLRCLGSKCMCQETNDRGYGSGRCVAAAGKVAVVTLALCGWGKC